MNIYGYEYISSMEVPGKLSMIVFFSGCNMSCTYCHNWNAVVHNNYVDVEEVKERIFINRPFIDNVVFSGGEPTLQYEALVELCKYCKNVKLETTVETNGTHPGVLDHLVQQGLLDRAHVDYKVSRVEDFRASMRATESIHREVHKTMFPDCINGQDLCEIAFNVPYGVPIVLQRGRSTEWLTTEEFDVKQLEQQAIRLPRYDVYINSEQGRMKVK